MTDATLIFGLGVTGYSCVRYLREECDVAICDTREHPPYLDAVRREYPDIPFFGSDQVRLGDFDRIVVSPGVRLDHGLVAEACAAGLRIVGDIDLFLAAAEAPVVGITGTNGKSTVTTLVGELLSVGHNQVGVGGNLGIAALDLIDPTRTHYVLELSSFHLERLGPAHFDVATVLNVSDDHLDRYVSFEAYAQTKRKIYDGCRRAVYNAADPPRPHRRTSMPLR